MPEGAVRLLDRRRLPAEEVYAECRDVAAVAHAIRTMQIYYRDQCSSTHGASQGSGWRVRDPVVSLSEPHAGTTLGVTGSIAAYKAVELVRTLTTARAGFACDTNLVIILDPAGGVEELPAASQTAGGASHL